jgi:hypothetical protein
MSHKKTLSELFRQSADKSSQMPSERVWERVTGRLDQPAQPLQPGRLRPLLRTVAAVALLLVLVWGVASLNQRSPLPASPTAQEDITPSVATVAVVMEQVALSRHYQQLPRINEGDALQRIVPRIALQ